jgi:hypothetical protein
MALAVSCALSCCLHAFNPHLLRTKTCRPSESLSERHALFHSYLLQFRAEVTRELELIGRPYGWTTKQGDS